MVVDIFFFFPCSCWSICVLQMSLEIGDGWENLIKSLMSVENTCLVRRGFGEEMGMEMAMERNGGWCGGPTYQPYLL